MVLPRVYRKATEQVIQTFDFIDIASGIGFVEYFGGNHGAGGPSGAHILSKAKFFSDQVSTVQSITSETTYTKFSDLDFDLVFNNAQTIEGEILCVIPSAVKAGTGESFQHFINVIIRKFDGTTETDIREVSGAFATITNLGTNDYDYDLTTIRLKMPSTLFKRGDTFRMTVEKFIKSNTQIAAFSVIGNDPENRAKGPTEDTNGGGVDFTFGTEVSRMSVLIPFKVDL